MSCNFFLNILVDLKKRSKKNQNLRRRKQNIGKRNCLMNRKKIKTLDFG